MLTARVILAGIREITTIHAAAQAATVLWLAVPGLMAAVMEDRAATVPAAAP